MNDHGGMPSRRATHALFRRRRRRLTWRKSIQTTPAGAPRHHLPQSSATAGPSRDLRMTETWTRLPAPPPPPPLLSSEQGTAILTSRLASRLLTTSSCASAVRAASSSAREAMAAGSGPGGRIGRQATAAGEGAGARDSCSPPAWAAAAVRV